MWAGASVESSVESSGGGVEQRRRRRRQKHAEKMLSTPRAIQNEIYVDAPAIIDAPIPIELRKMMPSSSPPVAPGAASHSLVNDDER